MAGSTVTEIGRHRVSHQALTGTRMFVRFLEDAEDETACGADGSSTPVPDLRTRHEKEAERGKLMAKNGRDGREACHPIGCNEGWDGTRRESVSEFIGRCQLEALLARGVPTSDGSMPPSAVYRRLSLRSSGHIATS